MVLNWKNAKLLVSGDLLRKHELILIDCRKELHQMVSEGVEQRVWQA